VRPEIRDRTGPIRNVATTVVAGRAVAVLAGGDTVRVWDLAA